MRITLTKHGGLAAGMRLPEQSIDPPQSIDLDKLDSSTAARVSNLVKVAVDTARDGSPSRAMPDAMSYIIKVEDGEKVTTLRESDASMSPAFAELLDTLEQVLSSAG